MTSRLICLLGVPLVCGPLAAAPPSPVLPAAAKVLTEKRLPAMAVTPAMASVPIVTPMPLTGLNPSKIFPDLCLYHYRAGTPSPECQEFIDQGLGFFYSYTWMEAARSFETALRHDPDCAFAWWGLSKSLEKWNKKAEHVKALQKAGELLAGASHREQKLITARLQEHGLIGEIKPEDRNKEAAKTLDDLLCLYDDDQEAWFARAQIAKALGGGTSSVPYYKALLRINPLHPGANHELVHFYETWQRPALGWPYAEKYIESSPGLPHAWHMQAHLATRLGKWDKTTDRSVRAIELQQRYHEFMGVAPRQDQQYSHHLETLTLSLVHDGRFEEAIRIEKTARGIGLKHRLAWFQLHRARRDWDACAKVVEEYRKENKHAAAYLEATMHLDRDEPELAEPAIDVVNEMLYVKKEKDKYEPRFWEIRGRYLVQTGEVDEGLKLLRQSVQRTFKDFKHHAWGNGSYYMEAWGLAALAAGRTPEAKEAFLEALAHDAGSVRGALGMEVLSRRLGRDREADRFADLADRCWDKADPGRLDELRSQIAGRVAVSVR